MPLTYLIVMMILDGDDTNGFVQNIDLDSQITDILGPLQDPDDFNVTFHETQTDATDGTDALSSPYTNTTANQQTIYVRVENKETQGVSMMTLLLMSL